MNTINRPDQLRWQVTPILFVVLDADDQIQVEVLGQRAPVENRYLLTEAIRQAAAQRTGYAKLDEVAGMSAKIADEALTAQHAAIRDHILAAIGHQVIEAQGRLSVEEFTAAIADDAMGRIVPVLAESVTTTANGIILGLGQHPTWRDMLRLAVRHADNDHAADLYDFALAVAALPMPDPEASEVAGTLADAITQAQHLTRTGDSEGGHIPATPGSSPNGHGGDLSCN